MIETVDDFAPEGTEAGVGLALKDQQGRYLFFLAGTRHYCPPGELFYAGIGGHREAGVDCIDCAHREVREEIGVEVEILSSPITWYVPKGGPAEKVEVDDWPRPLALYEMIHPAGTPREGELYRIVIFQARLLGVPKNLQLEEVLGVIALTPEQVIRGPQRRPTVAELEEEGGAVIAGGEGLDRELRVYPIGTAMALARVLQQE
jgi:8-oxo-dGTP pyrophosphatase MutT (NUDIX family)